MKADKRKVVIVGTGMVGMSYAYSLLNQSICDELVLIDVNKKRAEGEAMDLNHGLAFANSSMTIYAGEYSDCSDADIVVISAGVAQKPGETRLDLLKRNGEVFRSIIEPVTSSGFNGIFLVATNPADIMTRITCALSGFNPRRVLGSGTALDTARLRYLLGDYLKADPRNVHAYVMGEHGDSEFVPWSQALLATKAHSGAGKRSRLGKYYKGSERNRGGGTRQPPTRSLKPKTPPTTASAWLSQGSPRPSWEMNTVSSLSPPCCGENTASVTSMQACPASSIRTVYRGYCRCR